MRAVILAGGTGSRLRPLTNLINKHLLPVGEQPMISHAVNKLRQAGVTDILIITSRSAAGMFTAYLGSGDSEGVALTYKVQEQAGGIAEALALAEGFVGLDDKFIVLLGDNLFEDPLKPHIEAFRQQKDGAMVLLKEVHDPERYGVPVFTGDGSRIERIEEKPENPSSSFCVTGIYMYDASVFDRVRAIEPSARGELEITDVNNAYAADGKLSSRKLEGWWTDAGTFDSLYEASARMRGARG
ncbi:spore coat protein [Paenibacillus sambharensis]|uniref:Glucose-1-phosphate thymidylyltransferase n=1 Tax=Paenibacillus sambharensis TaxID=1803190 RepID=A0A2W1L845_9BACL|nr:sugar phosphate nucleotidyltransferase [Paenibacillus sambharensis]PZD95133.1 spore coat protein [Paenibacillus sambharensis]